MKTQTPDFDITAALPGDTVLLEASAGTGKTYTIAHLVVRYLAERNIGIDKLLVVTFTEAATRELRERIRKRICESIDALRGEPCRDAVLDAWARESSKDEERGKLYRQRLERALTDFDAASISTIHGFCSRVLTQAAFESGADYAAELVQDARSLHRDLVFDHLATKLVELPGPQYERAFDSKNISLRDLSILVEELVRNPKARLLPDDAPTVEEAEAKRVESRRALATAWQREGKRIRAALEEDLSRGVLKGKLDDGGHLDDVFRTVERVLATEELLRDSDRERLASLTTEAVGKCIREAKKQKRSDIWQEPIFELFSAHLEDESSLARALALSLQSSLADRVRNELPARKRKLGVLTFDDLLALVASSLAPKDARLRVALRERFKVALIDEFQDTDPIQWAIFRAIFHEGGLPLLLIGDPKQAIYSFRGADLEVYLEARDEVHARYRLATNHRSDGPLVEAVNDVFLQFDDSLGHPKLAYEPVSAAHREPRLLVGGHPIAPLRFLPAALENADNLPGISDPIASWVAKEMLGFLQSGAEIVEGEAARPVTPRDCAVLVGSNFRAKQVEEALHRVGIPCVRKGDESVFSSDEAADLSIWLHALADPTSLSRLSAWLATPLAGKAAQEIERVRQDESLFETEARRLSDWARLFARHGLMRALRAMVLELDIEERIASEPGGERRLTDLWHTAELLHAAKSEERLDAAGLALYLERARSEGERGDERRRLRLETDADAVEIVTVHRSKGLEYPVVICCELHREVDAKWPLRYTREGERILDILPNEEAKELARRDQLQEGLRLAYVALTRAKHLCIVPWAQPSSKQQSRRSPLDWLFFGDLPETSWKEARGEVLDHLSRRYADKGDRIAVLSQGFTPKVLRYERRAEAKVEPMASTYQRERPLDTRYRWSSYSSIVRGRQIEERSGSDEDSEREGALVSNLEKSSIDDPEARLPAHLAGFKHGTQLGNLLHEVLETIDFQTPSNLVGEIESRLDRFGIRSRLAQHPSLVRDIAHMLSEVLQTKLSSVEGDGFRLSDIALRDRMSELRFAFSIGKKGEGAEASLDDLSLMAIADSLSRYPRPSFPKPYGEELSKLNASGLRGLVHGSIDLVFRRGGRYYVVDYKSNHLGDLLGNYANEPLLHVMQKDHYLLQAQIYALALHRFLRQRLRGYDPSSHFGGVYYLFLRGMKVETGSRFGVYFDRPPKEALADLDLAFSGEGAGR